MRVLLQVLLVILFSVCGLMFGAFNPQPERIDFHVFQIPTSLGIALLAALFIGALLGGLAVTIGIVWPLRRRLRRLARESGLAADASRRIPTPSA